MKTITVLILLIVLLFISCNNIDPKENSVILISELDTFYLGDKLIYVKKATKSDFDKLPTQILEYDYEKLDSNNLIKDSSVVKRKGDTLFFTISDNKIDTLIGGNRSDGDFYDKYFYLGYISDIGQYLAYFIGNEEECKMLIDSKTGDITIIDDEPVVSPNKKYFISRIELEIGGDYCGFDLYKNSHKPKLVGSRELKKWCPSEIKWYNDSTLLLKVSILDSEKNYVTDYLKLHWKK